MTFAGFPAFFIELLLLVETVGVEPTSKSISGRLTDSFADLIVGLSVIRKHLIQFF